MLAHSQMGDRGIPFHKDADIPTLFLVWHENGSTLSLDWHWTGIRMASVWALFRACLALTLPSVWA